MVVNTMSPLMSVAILRDGYTVAAGGVDGKGMRACCGCVCVCACVRVCVCACVCVHVRACVCV